MAAGQPAQERRSQIVSRTDAMRSRRYAARKRTNIIATTLALGAMSFGLFWLGWILWETLRLGRG